MRSFLLVLGCLAFVEGTVPVQAEPSPRRLILPLVVNGGRLPDGSHFQSTFSFLNLSATAAEGTIGVYENEGALRTGFLICEPVPLPPRLIPLSLPGGGLLHPPSYAAGDLLEGWGEVLVEGGRPLAASVEISRLQAEPTFCGVICNRPSGVIQTSVQLSAVEPARNFQAVAAITAVRHPAFGIVNPSETETARVTIRLRDAAGATYMAGPPDHPRPAAYTYEIPPRHRFAGLLWDLLFLPLKFVNDPLLDPPPPPELPDMFHGSVEFTSDQPIAVAGVNVLLPDGKLVAVEVAAGPEENP